MLSITNQYTSQLFRVTATVDHTKNVGCRIMQFSEDQRCLTPVIARAAMAMLKSDKTSAQAAIFRNALECGYQQQLLNMIHARYSAFVPSMALQSMLADEGIVLDIQNGNLILTRVRAEPAMSPSDQVTMEALNELGLPTSIAALICKKATISPQEKNGGIQHYLGTDIAGWTHQQINDALIKAFRSGKSLPEGVHELMITDFEFSVPKGQTCNVPDGIRLHHCRSTSAVLRFSLGVVTAIRKGATVVANGPWSHAIAGAAEVTVRAMNEGSAIAAVANSRAEAIGRKSISLAKAPGAVAIARAGAAAHALAEGSRAVAYSGSRAIAKASGSVATVESSEHLKDKDSVAIARGRQAEAVVYVDRATGVALDGATVVARARLAVIHAYGHSSAEGLESDAIVVKHGKLARVWACNGAVTHDLTTRIYSAATIFLADDLKARFSRLDKLIYSLTDEEMTELNDKTPDERDMFRMLLDEGTWLPDVLLAHYDELRRRQQKVRESDLRASLISRQIPGKRIFGLRLLWSDKISLINAAIEPL